ncbi:MAG: DUF998 domain-containing protein [Jatrophihabitantaceae bacterium]
MSRRGATWWALVSATSAPIVLIGGWTLAASRQPRGYSVAQDTISALAARGATDRWIMTLGLLILGACHVSTAAGLRAARPLGRVLLAVGGVGTLVVAAAPQPAHGSSHVHVVAALTAFVLLSVWAVAATSADSDGPLAGRTGQVATGVLLALLLIFGVSTAASSFVGASERALAGAQALWPLVVVLAARRSRFPAVTRTDRGD